MVCALWSNMHGLKYGSCRIWQRTDLPPDSNMLRRAAQTCSACKLAGVQIIPLPTLANQILARTIIRSVVLLCACPAVGKFSRASSAGGRLNLQSNVEQSDRVGRRGLFEPGGKSFRCQKSARTIFEPIHVCPQGANHSSALSTNPRKRRTLYG